MSRAIRPLCHIRQRALRSRIRSGSMKVLAPRSLFCSSVFLPPRTGWRDRAFGNSLEEVRDKRNALLVVFKSRVIDVTDRERAIIQDVLKADPRPKGRYRWVYTIIARKLNKYISKYNSLSPAKRAVGSRLRDLFQCG